MQLGIFSFSPSASPGAARRPLRCRPAPSLRPTKQGDIP